MVVTNQMLSHQYAVLYEQRICYHEDVDIIKCSGKLDLGKFEGMCHFNGFNFNRFQNICFLEPRREFKIAVINSQIFIVGGINNSYRGYLDYAEIYSKKTKTWKVSAKWPRKRFGFCVAAFMKQLFVIGGSNFGNPNYTNSCLKYDLKDDKWSYIASMNGRRFAAACTIFEGRIVVTGGVCFHKDLKSVESYDHYDNKWTYLPDVIEKKKMSCCS